MILYKTIQKAYIDTAKVSRGMTAHVLETGKDKAFSGYVSSLSPAVNPTSVTLKGTYIGESSDKTLTMTAEQLDANDYQVFRYTPPDMDKVLDEATEDWVSKKPIEAIDPDVCKTGYFIMYRKAPSDPYTNGLVSTVEDTKLSVTTILPTGKSFGVDLTLADVKKAGFDAIVSPTIEGGTVSGGSTVTILGDD